jgi:DNA-binding transcriptional LysR family regulator
VDRLTSLRVYREIVETGSFAAAAKKLGVSAPMVSKHIAQLELSVGARLLHRSSRHLSPTEAGESYYAHCRQALEILDAADAEIHQVSSRPRGQLKISAPIWCANKRFSDALAEYHQRYPEVVVDLHLENRMVDLVAESYDLALRVSMTPSPNLIARKICNVEFLPVATPEYLAQLEAPGADKERMNLEIIAPNYFDLNKMFRPRLAKAAAPRPTVVMRSDNSYLSYLSVLAGVGYAVLPDWIVADDIASGRLVAPETDHPLTTLTLHAVYASRRHVPLKVRSFIDFFSKQLGGSPNQKRVRGATNNEEPRVREAP